MRIFWAAIVPSWSRSAGVRELRARAPLSSTSRVAPRRPGPVGPGRRGVRLLEDLRDSTGTDGAAALTDGEAQTVLHRDGLDELHGHLGVVARHDHLRALGEGDDAGDVGGPEV